MIFLKRFTLLLLWGFVFALLPFTLLAKENSSPIARTIIALFDSKDDIGMHYSATHQLAEMPLNFLGLNVEYHDIQKDLPDIKDRQDVRGVISWFFSGTFHKDPEYFLLWAAELIDAGKKIAILGSPGFSENKQGKPTPIKKINRFMKKLGMRDMNSYEDLTYDARVIHEDLQIMGFERQVKGFKFAYEQIVPISGDVNSHLVIQKGKDPDSVAHLVVTTPSGGYVADGYALYEVAKEDFQVRQWYINPFEFFRLSFATDDLPKPDIATLAGRRIYYSHIDGDGWNNVSELEEYKDLDRDVICAEVILEKIIRPHPELPVTVAPVIAELNPKWVARKDSAEIAKKFFSLPQVEVGVHTYSHPLNWGFFENNDPNKEIPYLHKYPGVTWQRPSAIKRLVSLFSKEKIYTEDRLAEEYKIPRSYAKEPFALNLEIQGSIQFLKRLIPSHKEVKIYMWSGNTLPFEEAVKAARLAGLQNINGGDTRLDIEFPSYAWVSPIGRTIGKEHQIYSSNSNETTYTDLWTDRFYGYRFLVSTLLNTETPLRVKPINVYYHMYSGEKPASLTALKENLEFARTQEITPVTASHYSQIAQGFYSTRLIPIKPNSWRIENRGRLQTIRFDRSSLKAVDFSRSSGIVGQRHFQGSLYVYLDEAAENSVITLKKMSLYYQEPSSTVPYLIKSRWPVWNLQRGKKSFTFSSGGFGKAEMEWKVKSQRNYAVLLKDKETILYQGQHTSDPTGKLSLNLNISSQGPLTFSVSEI